MLRGLSSIQPAFLLAGIAVSSLAGCNPMTAWTNNQSGKVLYKAGRYAEAGEEFRRAAIDNPRNPDYIHNYATASRRAGKLAIAEQSYRQALALDPNHQPSYHGLAVTLQKSGRGAEAHAMLSNWSASRPYSAEPLIEMAWLQKEMGDYTGAERSLAHALLLQPGHPLALANLGQVYEETGRTQLARAAYQRSLATDWNQPQVASRINQLGGTSRPFPPTTVAAVPPVYNPVSVIGGPTPTAAPVGAQPTPAAATPAPTPGPIASPPPASDGQQSSTGGNWPSSPYAATPAGHFPGSPYQPSQGLPLARQPFQPTTGTPLARQPFTNGRAYMGIESAPVGSGIQQSSGKFSAPMVPRQ